MMTFPMNRVILIGYLLTSAIHGSAQSRDVLQIRCASQAVDGYVSIETISNKPLKNKRLDYAKKESLTALLFSGLAGNENCQTQTPMLQTPENQAAFEKVRHKFFSRKGQWRNFVRTGDSSNISRNDKTTLVVIISKSELRKYLENQHILSPLNHGF